MIFITSKVNNYFEDNAEFLPKIHLSLKRQAIIESHFIKVFILPIMIMH